MDSPSPDPSADPDAFEVDPALAASMGFTSFGTAPRPAKRMKMSQSSGANTVQIGARKRFLGVNEVGKPKETGRENPEEIDLDMDDVDDENGSKEQDTEKTQGDVEEAQPDTTAATITESASVPDPATASTPKTKQKGKGKGKAPASFGLAGFLARGQKIEPPAPTLSVPTPTEPAAAESSEPSTVAEPESMELPLHSPYHARPPPLPPYVPPKRLEDLTNADLAILRQGVRNERGDLEIFAMSFVEDPWKGQGQGKTFKSAGKA